ncbi:MAG: NifU family protein [Gemmatimonadota bacterium]
MHDAQRGIQVVSVEEQIEAVLESIRPALRMDGGDVEFLGFRAEDGVAEIRWLGACESCPISMQTLKLGIERRVTESVPEVTGVQAV